MSARVVLLCLGGLLSACYDPDRWQPTPVANLSPGGVDDLGPANCMAGDYSTDFSTTPEWLDAWTSGEPGAQSSVTDGRLRVLLNEVEFSSAGIRTPALTFVERRFTVHVLPMVAPGQPVDFQFGIDAWGAPWLRIMSISGLLFVSYRDGQTGSLDAVPPRYASAAFWELREHAGHVTLAVSSDGVRFDAIADFDTPAWTENVVLRVGAGTEEAPLTPGEVQFDDLSDCLITE